MDIYVSLEKRNKVLKGDPKKVYIGNFFQRLFRVGPFREEPQYDYGIFKLSPGLELYVLAYTENLEWIDTLYYGNRIIEDSHVRLKSPDDRMFDVEVDLRHLSDSYKYLVFVCRYKIKDDEDSRVVIEYSYDWLGKEKSSPVYRDVSDSEWHIIGYLDNTGKKSEFVEPWESWAKIKDETPIDIAKRIEKYENRSGI